MSPRALLTSVLLCAGVARADDVIKLAIYDFHAPPQLQGAAGAVSGALAAEMGRYGLFKITTPQGIAVLLGRERQRQLLGCTDDSSSCMAEIADALGTDYLVTGNLVPLAQGSQTVLSLEVGLLDAHKSRRENAVFLKAASEAGLVEQARQAVATLLRPVLRLHSGTVSLTSSEKGASIKLDGEVAGVTPLKEPITLAAGPHELEVQKEGFVSSTQTVKMTSGAQLQLEVRLLPSDDFLKAYRRKASSTRLAAWLTAGLAVVGAAGFAISWTQMSLTYGSPQSAGTFQYYKGRLQAGYEIEGGVDNRARADALANTGQAWLTGAMVGLGICAAAAVTSIILWIVGDDPHRYENLEQAR